MITTSVTPLMPSRLISAELDRMASNDGTGNIKTMAVRAGLTLSFSSFIGDSLREVAAKLSGMTSEERENIAKKIHPVICAMKLQIQGNNPSQYLAEKPHPCGTPAARVILTQDGSAVFSD